MNVVLQGESKYFCCFRRENWVDFRGRETEKLRIIRIILRICSKKLNYSEFLQATFQILSEKQRFFYEKSKI